MRDNLRVSLDGTWDFQISSGNASDATPQTEWRSAIVPLPWQAQFDDLRNTSGVAWYRRQFVIDQAFVRSAAGSVAILHFGAVDYHATIWLNGELIGAHEGGYLPFEFEVINRLHEGDNELLIKVVDPTDDRQRYADFPFSEVPHGKQSWYGPIGGIWQSVGEVVSVRIIRSVLSGDQQHVQRARGAQRYTDRSLCGSQRRAHGRRRRDPYPVGVRSVERPRPQRDAHRRRRVLDGLSRLRC
jgi:hypothetical protein